MVVPSRYVGVFPLLCQVPADSQVRPATNELVPSQTDFDLGRIVVLLVINRLLAQPELAPRQFCPLLVGDSKMVSAPAVLACHRHHLFYLGARGLF